MTEEDWPRVFTDKYGFEQQKISRGFSRIERGSEKPGALELATIPAWFVLIRVYPR